jgi:hypothetical protein
MEGEMPFLSQVRGDRIPLIQERVQLVHREITIGEVLHKLWSVIDIFLVPGPKIPDTRNLVEKGFFFD